MKMHVITNLALIRPSNRKSVRTAACSFQSCFAAFKFDKHRVLKTELVRAWTAT